MRFPFGGPWAKSLSKNCCDIECKSRGQMCSPHKARISPIKQWQAQSRTVGRAGGGRTDGRSDGQPKPKKSTFLKKKDFLAGRVRDGRLFPYFGRFFPYFRTGRPGALRQKSTFRKKRYSSQFRIMTLEGASRAMSSRLVLGPWTWEDVLPLRWNSHQAARQQIAHYLTHESISPWVIFWKILVHSDNLSVAAIIFLGEDITPVSQKSTDNG